MVEQIPPRGQPRVNELEPSGKPQVELLFAPTQLLGRIFPTNGYAWDVRGNFGWILKVPTVGMGTRRELLPRE